MALLCLPAFHSSASPPAHLSRAQRRPHQLSPSLRNPATAPGLFPRPAFSSPPPAEIAAATAAIALPRGGRRTWSCFSLLAAPESGGAESAVAETSQEAGESRTRLIAQNIPWTCTAEDIRELFAKHGTVLDVERFQLSMYNKTRNRGLAFVTMATEEEALSALNNLNSYELDGRLMRVEFARTLKKKSSIPTAESVTKYNVFVGNLDWRVRSRNIRELFASAYPNILSAEVIFQSNPRRPAGFGFVSFRSQEEAEAAVSAFNGKKVMGRAIRLVFGKQQPANSDGSPSERGELEGKAS
ncbi:hypothetical protein Taro_023114 [Colocasia esculenta]|uniref:RRM domain-containing protein n=1 Tax=Colocasia esculenta TaxID=4460 RepID=A0A843V318_COLES|nr:hypothetical protein [Colocasia esculenta]